MATDPYTPLLHAYLDSELDLVRSLELEEHMKSCPDCAQEIWTQQTLRQGLRSGSLYHRAPAGLEARIRASLPLENKVIEMPRRNFWNWVAVAAAIVVALVLTWRMLPSFLGRSQTDLLAQEVVSSHIRSLQPGHLMDVESTDQHTVKPWFTGKLDFSPEVRDFSADGFDLVGGRLEYVDGHDAAAIVYQRRKHVINVFMWPSLGPDQEPRTIAQQGFNLVEWKRARMYYCAVSDLSQQELSEFSLMLRR